MKRNGKVKEKREEREQQEEKQKREEKGNTKDTETENESIYHKQAQGPDQQTATMLAQLQTLKKTQQHHEYETKEEKETTIRQDAEYWQTNGKTTKMKKIIVTNIRH